MTRNLLYVTPVVPALTGNGLAMRAATMLHGLAEDHAVHLLVVPVVAGPAGDHIAPAVAGSCARVAIQPTPGRVDPLWELIARVKDPRERRAAQLAYPRPALCRFATVSSIGAAAGVFEGVAFHEVHVFRLYMAPFARPYLEAPAERRPTCRLDLDDHESATRHRLAELYESNHQAAAAQLERAESEKYAALEKSWLPRFDRVYVCSERDRRAIATQHGCAHAAVIPNAVRIPSAAGAGPGGAPLTLLFVGNLGYYPNGDAALWFCREILPLLSARAPAAFRVLFVGSDPPTRLRRLGAAAAGVIVTGAVPDVGEYYRQANLVVIPLRAGGGTRIKLLEAFAYRRPVVTTTVGAEGIEARHGTHVLMADTPSDFADQCARLMSMPALGHELARRAFELVSTRHTPDTVRELLRRDHGRETS